MKSILGIDPGLSGALAIYDGEELLVFDIPTFEITKNGKVKKRIDLMGLLNILRSQKVDHCYLEKVNAMPGQGVTSMFSMGRTFGHIEMALAACDVPVTEVTPQKWKKIMGCTADKDSSRLRASQMLPLFSQNWDKKKHADRAEAALIALYGYGDIDG